MLFLIPFLTLLFTLFYHAHSLSLSINATSSYTFPNPILKAQSTTINQKEFMFILFSNGTISKFDANFNHLAKISVTNKSIVDFSICNSNYFANNSPAILAIISTRTEWYIISIENPLIQFNKFGYHMFTGISHVIGHGIYFNSTNIIQMKIAVFSSDIVTSFYNANQAYLLNYTKTYYPTKLQTIKKVIPIDTDSDKLYFTVIPADIIDIFSSVKNNSIYFYKMVATLSPVDFFIDNQSIVIVRHNDSTSAMFNTLLKRYAYFHTNATNNTKGCILKAIRPAVTGNGERLFLYDSKIVRLNLNSSSYWNYVSQQSLGITFNQSSKLGFVVLSSSNSSFLYQVNNTKIHAYCESLASGMCTAGVILPYCNLKISWCQSCDQNYQKCLQCLPNYTLMSNQCVQTSTSCVVVNCTYCFLNGTCLTCANGSNLSVSSNQCISPASNTTASATNSSSTNTTNNTTNTVNNASAGNTIMNTTTSNNTINNTSTSTSNNTVTNLSNSTVINTSNNTVINSSNNLTNITINDTIYISIPPISGIDVTFQEPMQILNETNATVSNYPDDSQPELNTEEDNLTSIYDESEEEQQEPEIVEGQPLSKALIDNRKNSMSASAQGATEASKQLNSSPMIRIALGFMSPLFAFFDDYWFYIYNFKFVTKEFSLFSDLLILMQDINSQRSGPIFREFDYEFSIDSFNNSEKFKDYTYSTIYEIQGEIIYTEQNFEKIIFVQYPGVFIIIIIVKILTLLIKTLFFQKKNEDQPTKNKQVGDSQSSMQPLKQKIRRVFRKCFFRFIQFLENMLLYRQVLMTFFGSNIIYSSFILSSQLRSFFSFKFIDSINLVIMMIFWQIFIIAFVILVVLNETITNSQKKQQTILKINANSIINTIKQVKETQKFQIPKEDLSILIFTGFKLVSYGFIHGYFIFSSPLQYSLLIIVKVFLIVLIFKFKQIFEHKVLSIMYSSYYISGILIDITLLLPSAKILSSQLLKAEFLSYNIYILVQNIFVVSMVISILMASFTHIFVFIFKLLCLSNIKNEIIEERKIVKEYQQSLNRVVPFTFQSLGFLSKPFKMKLRLVLNNQTQLSFSDKNGYFLSGINKHVFRKQGKITNNNLVSFQTIQGNDRTKKILFDQKKSTQRYRIGNKSKTKCEQKQKEGWDIEILIKAPGQNTNNHQKRQNKTNNWLRPKKKQDEAGTNRRSH